MQEYSPALRRDVLAVETAICSAYVEPRAMQALNRADIPCHPCLWPSLSQFFRAVERGFFDVVGARLAGCEAVATGSDCDWLAARDQRRQD
jgi:hypothetical protein